MTSQLSSEVELFTTQYIDNIKNDLTLPIDCWQCYWSATAKGNSRSNGNCEVIRDLQHFFYSIIADSIFELTFPNYEPDRSIVHTYVYVPCEIK